MAIQSAKINSSEIKKISWSAKIPVLCRFIFFFWYRFLWTVLQYHNKEKIPRALMFEARYTNMLLVLFIYPVFFRLSTVAGIHTMTLHRISSPPCIIGESRYCVDVNCTSISAPLSSKYFVMRLIYCGRSPTAPGS